MLLVITVGKGRVKLPTGAPSHPTPHTPACFACFAWCVAAFRASESRWGVPAPVKLIRRHAI